jgi:thiol-disulfide isomerase/thioredoxin
VAAPSLLKHAPRISLIAFCLVLARDLRAKDVPSTRPADPVLNDLQGISRRPLSPGDDRASVLIFIRTDCPISNAYAPEINRLVKEYGPRKIVFYVVYTMRDLSERDARQHAKAYGYTCPAILDGQHQLVDAIGATVTPEVAVIGHDRKLIYRGRIDDLFLALGRQRYQATTHELRDALDAVLADRQPALPRTSAVGCAIAKD